MCVVHVFAEREVERDGGLVLSELRDFLAKDADTAHKILEKEGWEVISMVEVDWLKNVKSELVTTSPFLRLEEGYNKIGILVKEEPQREEDERFGKKRTTYLLKVKYHVTPDGHRHDFDEPKLWRVSTKLMEEIIKALEAKLTFAQGGVPDVVEITVQRTGTDSQTRYKVVG